MMLDQKITDLLPTLPPKPNPIVSLLVASQIFKKEKRKRSNKLKSSEVWLEALKLRSFWMNGQRGRSPVLELQALAPVRGVPPGRVWGQGGAGSIGEDLTGAPLLRSQSFLYETDLLGFELERELLQTPKTHRLQ